MNFSEALEQMISNHKDVRIFRTVLIWDEREHKIIVKSDLSQNVDEISIDDFIQIYKSLENEELFSMEGEGMNFTEALKMMKAGIPMKLPTMDTYWYWDDENDKVMVKFKEVESTPVEILLTHGDTQKLTIPCILSDKWITATEENVFDFGDAIKYLKRGMKVKRQGWNGKEQYIELAKNIAYRNPDGKIINSEHEAIGNMAIAFVGTSGVQLGWCASQADMLADDWVFA